MGAAEATTTKRTTSVCMEKTAPHGFRFFMDVAAVATANSAESSSVRGNSAVGTGHNQGGLYTASGSAWFAGTQDAEQWY